MALEAEHGVLRIEGHGDGALLLEQHRLEQVGRLLGQDERRGDLVPRLGLVLHELVRVGSHERQRLGLQVDVDAVHHGAQLVVGRGKDGLVDAVHQRIDVELDLLLFGAQLRHGGIAHGRRAGNRERTALPVDADLPVLVIDVDFERQFGELLERIEHQLGRCGDRAFGLDAVHLDRPHERRLEIRRGDLQRRAAEFHEEVVQDRKRVFIADDLAGRSQKRKKRRA